MARGVAQQLGWEAPAGLDLAGWLRHGSVLTANGACVPWAVGDWMRFGRDRFGVSYGSAAVVTGYGVQSLRNMVYVASRFAAHRRRCNVPWSAYAMLAALPPETQEQWLGRVHAERLTMSELRRLLGAARAQVRDPVAFPLSHPSQQCPDRGRPVEWPSPPPDAA